MFQLLKVCPILALSFLGGAVSQDPYTILPNPSANNNYSATSSGAVVTIEGDYFIPVAFDASSTTYDYSQQVYAGSTCGTTTELSSPEVTGSGTTLQASFGINLATATAAVYVENVSTGTITVCHRIEVRNGALLMNQVDTEVTATVDLAATFDSGNNIVTVASAPLSGDISEQIDLSEVLSVALSPTTALSAGNPLTVTITSDSDTTFSLTTAELSDDTVVYPIPGTPSNLLATANGCVSTTSCTLGITLGFTYFESATTLTLSGTASLELNSARRLQEGTEEVPFAVTFQTLEYTASGSTLVTPWGSLMVAAAVVFA